MTETKATQETAEAKPTVPSVEQTMKDVYAAIKANEAKANEAKAK